jgi:hypothetical protein
VRRVQRRRCVRRCAGAATLADATGAGRCCVGGAGGAGGKGAARAVQALALRAALRGLCDAGGSPRYAGGGPMRGCILLAVV